MFCGLPVMVPVEPMLAAVASPIKCGSGSNFIRRARCKTNGVSATQTTSLIRNADNSPAKPIVTASSPRGVEMCRSAIPVSRSKQPERRRAPTTIIMPNSRNSVLKSIDCGLTASSRLSTPVTSISVAPTRAMPARSMRKPGTLPSASPA